MYTEVYRNSAVKTFTISSKLLNELFCSREAKYVIFMNDNPNKFCYESAPDIIFHHFLGQL